MKNTEPTSTGGQATASPCSSKSKAKSKSIPNGPNAQASFPATTQANGAALAKSAASAAIVEAVHGHSNGTGSLGTTDRNEFVREVLTLINVRRLPSHMSWWPFIHVISFPSGFPFVLVLIDRSLVRGSTLDGISRACVAYVDTLLYLPWCLPACLPPTPTPYPLPPEFPCTLCCNEISVSMYCRAMYQTCTDMY